MERKTKREGQGEGRREGERESVTLKILWEREGNRDSVAVSCNSFPPRSEGECAIRGGGRGRECATVTLV